MAQPLVVQHKINYQTLLDSPRLLPGLSKLIFKTNANQRFTRSLYLCYNL